MNRSIRANINIGVFIVIIFCCTALIIIFSVYYRQRVYNDILSRLDIALQTAWDQIYIDDASIKSTLEENACQNNVSGMIESRDQNGMDSLISSLVSRRQRTKFFLITDSEGLVMSSSFDGEVGKKCCFNNIMNYFIANPQPLCTFELMTESEIALASEEFKECVRVTSAQNNNKDISALVRLVAVPVYDVNSELIGCVIGGYLLNNRKELAESYTSKVPNTYLSIAIDGLRVVSNIAADDFIYDEGSLQEDVLIKTTQAGEPYQGRIYMSGEEALIDIDPIFNYEGEVIGNMGVGSPTFNISELGFQSILIIVLFGSGVMLVSTVVVRKINTKLTTPIVELQRFAKDITDKELKPQEIEWNEKRVPPELQELAETMTIMAKKLMMQKLYLEVKVKERTQQLTETINELEQANNYKSQFLANVSHELRTPLNSIIGFASLLKDNLYGTLNEKQELYVSTIISSGNHLMDLINDILQIIKIDKGIIKLFPKPINLTQLFEDVSNLVFPTFNEKEQKFFVKIEDDVPLVTWDEEKIKQVLLNLLSNSAKFTPEGGKISMSAEMRGENVLMKVSDTGIGVPEDMREKVFLAFEQANSSYTKRYQGVGLGLAICKSLVELHCGKIWINENHGGGALTCILIPIKPFDENEICEKPLVLSEGQNNKE